MLGTQSARLVTVSPLLNRYWKKLRRWVGGVLSRNGGLRVVSRWRKATVSLGAIALNSTSASPKRKLRNRSAKRQQGRSFVRSALADGADSLLSPAAGSRGQALLPLAASAVWPHRAS